MNQLHHIRQMIFNQPLMMEPSRAEVIVDYLNQRLYGIEPNILSYTGLQASALEDDRDERERLQDGKLFETVGPIAVLQIIGETVRRKGGMDALSGLTSYEGFTKSHRAAMADTNIKAIMTFIDSPGGPVSGLNLCAAELESGNMKNGGKPHLAYLDEGAFSAGYRLASCHDWIVAPDCGVPVAGSIGCCAMLLDKSKMLDEAGLKPIMIRSHDRKARGGGLEPIDDTTIAELQKNVDDIGHDFCQRVSVQRGVPLDIIEGTEAGVFTAQDSLALGLIDQIGDQDDAFEAILGLI
jgi:capsid assembly protease